VLDVEKKRRRKKLIGVENSPADFNRNWSRSYMTNVYR